MSSNDRLDALAIAVNYWVETMDKNEPKHDYSITLVYVDERREPKTVFVKHAEDLYDYLDAIKKEYVFGEADKVWKRIVIEVSDSGINKLETKREKADAVTQ